MTDFAIICALITGSALLLWLHHALADRNHAREVERIRESNAETHAEGAKLAEIAHAQRMEYLAAQRELNREWIEGQKDIHQPWRSE